MTAPRRNRSAAAAAALLLLAGCLEGGGGETPTGDAAVFEGCRRDTIGKVPNPETARFGGVVVTGDRGRRIVAYDVTTTEGGRDVRRYATCTIADGRTVVQVGDTDHLRRAVQVARQSHPDKVFQPR